MSIEPPQPDISAAELSRVIGLIYDCAIDPERWPVALEAISRQIGGCFASIGLYDPSQRSIRLSKFWGDNPNIAAVVESYETKYAALMPFHDFMPFSVLDEPLNTEMMMTRSGRPDFYETPFYKEWAEPAGFKDVATTILFRSETRFCILGLHTPVERDLVGPKELAIARLFTPHVKRAVLISDMLDMRALEASTITSTLDLLSTAVVLTDGRSQVIHANRAARAMLDANDPLQLIHARLTVRDDHAAHALYRAIARAATAESEMGASGIGVPIPFADGRPAVAHVLPLAAPPIRSRLAPAAKAAVFISTNEAHLAPVDALSALYALTATEGRVLASILEGRNQAETATHLGIADSTVKTHLGRIFSKTGAGSQAELVQLAERLAARLAPRPMRGDNAG